jgi:3-oxoacyl-[acyl-carrier protein] reductase
MIDLKKKVSVVTGGAQGIGKSIALRLAEAGSDIVIGDVNPEIGKQTAEEIKSKGVQSLFLPLDVSNYEKVEEFTNQTVEKFGKIDILVNNAGVTRDTLIMKMKPEDWDFVLKINLTGAFYCAKCILPFMAKARSGRIINIASIIGLMGNVGQANYSASKGGLIALTKTMAKEYASRNINVNAIAPGFIKTAMTDKLSEDVRNAMTAMIPKKSYGMPDDVANAVLFFASDLSSYVTGQVLVVDGGMVMA